MPNLSNSLPHRLLMRSPGHPNLFEQVVGYLFAAQLVQPASGRRPFDAQQGELFGTETVTVGSHRMNKLLR